MDKSSQAVRKKQATLRDVADLAGVSPMTVSNVVNEKFQFVGKETVKRVEAAIRKLNYRPSATSRRLRSMSAFSVGMVVVDENPAFLEDPMITEIVAGLSNHLSRNEYSVTIQGIGPEDFSDATVFSAIGTDAVCAILCGSDEVRSKYVDFLLTMSQPIVVFQETIRSKDQLFAVVNQDDYGGGRELGQHLLETGAKKLLFLQPSTHWPAMHERYRGLSDVILAQSGLELQQLTCPREDFRETQAVVGRHIEKHGLADCIVGGNDRLGIAAMRYLQDNGYEVPRDVLVSGFNGFESSLYTNPPLTTVVSPAYEMGQYAGKLILQKLQTGRYAKRRTLFPVAFRPGASTS